MAKSRNFMMNKLETQWGLDFVSTTEDFYGTATCKGIWLSGENGDCHKDGMELFNYWNEDHKNYTFGVYNKIGEWAEKNGWYFEWNDAGTIMLWPI